MPYADIKYKIDLLKEQIASYGKLTPENLKKINYKFRLEWNYNSNSMEGNTLTIEETRSIMVGNIDVHQKPYKDIAEMKGHDAVVTDILKIGKGELRLSEARIKQIHKSIMYEDDAAQKEKIGTWKTLPNQIINRKGEKYDFIAPEEVSNRVHDLLNRTNASIDAIDNGKKNAPHPLDVAFNFHLEYLDIHPFYDGNGRTARILTNLILIALGYPPFWINTKERDVYYSYLSDIQGYGGNPDLLNEYMAGLVLRSQQLILDVIGGNYIEEEEDLDKEIAIWKRQLGKQNEVVLAPKSKETLIECYYKSFKPLLLLLINKLSQFNDLFEKNFLVITIDDDHMSTLNSLDELEKRLLSQDLKPNETFYNISIKFYFKGFKFDGNNAFNKNAGINLYFEEFMYLINDRLGKEGDNYLMQLYSEQLDDESIKYLVKETVGGLFEDIKHWVHNNS